MRHCRAGVVVAVVMHGVVPVRSGCIGFAEARGDRVWRRHRSGRPRRGTWGLVGRRGGGGSLRALRPTGARPAYGRTPFKATAVRTVGRFGTRVWRDKHQEAVNESQVA